MGERSRPSWAYGPKPFVREARGKDGVTPVTMASRPCGSRPSAVAGHDRAQGGAHRVRKEKANSSRYFSRSKKQRGRPSHGEVERSGAMTDGGETASTAPTLLER
jgi:hypothetical protein